MTHHNALFDGQAEDFVCLERTNLYDHGIQNQLHVLQSVCEVSHVFRLSITNRPINEELPLL